MHELNKTEFCAKTVDAWILKDYTNNLKIKKD
jgi:hypothetical protein